MTRSRPEKSLKFESPRQRRTRNEHGNCPGSKNRFARGMARGAQGTARQRKETHTRPRRACRRAAQTSLGQGRKELRLRFAKREENVGRAFRRPQPAHDLPLHVRSGHEVDRKSTRLNSSHRTISYAVFCLKKKKQSRICSPLIYYQ